MKNKSRFFVWLIHYLVVDFFIVTIGSDDEFKEEDHILIII